MGFLCTVAWVCALAAVAAAEHPALRLATVVGRPAVEGGPSSGVFDSPYASAATTAGLVGYTANQRSYAYSRGTLNATMLDDGVVLDPPAFTGLGRAAKHASLPALYSQCGKWLNAVWVDPANASIVHGYYHQEWRCDYAHGFTNKSVGYAVSHDAGATFAADDAASGAAYPQIIAGANFTHRHQTGNGDHGVVQVGPFLYLYFLDWDGEHGVRIGAARAPVATRGAPGTWRKYCNGSFACAGVGGNDDAIANIHGTAVARIDVFGAVLSVGTKMSRSGAVEASWSPQDDPVTGWRSAAAGPVFACGRSDWHRTAGSSELYAYESIASATAGNGGVDAQGCGVTPGQPTSGCGIFFTYLAPGTTFRERYLVRRPLAAVEAPNATALELLSLWCRHEQPMDTLTWATTGPVVGGSWAPCANGSSVAMLATSGGVALVDCALGAAGVHLLDTAAGCVSRNGTVLRPAGSVASAAAGVDAARRFFGWAKTSVVVVVGDVTPQRLWRCGCGGNTSFAVALGDDDGAACRGACSGGVAGDVLGYALPPAPFEALLV